jgi:uncharacterized protein (TIGR03437 family)
MACISGFSTMLPRQARPGFVSLVCAALPVFLLAGASLVKAQQPGWTTTGSPAAGRNAGQRAVLLANGKVLVVGPGSFGVGIPSPELYDPATGQWSVAGNMSTPRSRPVLVRLANGKVLSAGGTGDTSAEIYDPDTGAWSPTGSLSIGRQTSAGVLLADGRVLVTGGSASQIAELYDPASGAWSSAGTMTAVRSVGPIIQHTSTLLTDGRVLVVGGSDNNGALRSAELYDPATGNWTATGSLITPRFNHTATLLPNGKVLVASGSRSLGACPELPGTELAELYDPATGQWSAASSQNTPRALYSATLLPSGKVLVVGADNSSCFSLASSELYDPVTGNWSALGNLKAAYIPLQTVLLANGDVLVVGGNGSGAELFDSGGLTSISAASLAAGGALAPESIASAIGTNLALATEAAPPGSAPIQLAGAGVKVRDSAGMERLAPLFYVSPGQINYLVPSGTATGLATVTVTSGGSSIAVGLVSIAGVAPGLFSADSSGQGAAAGFWIRVAEGGTQSYDYLFDLTSRNSVPLDLGSPNDQVFLSLYGTGFRAGTGATATVGGVSVPVSAFAPVTQYPGLDVVNLGPLPRSLIGRGEVNVGFFVDGKAANPVNVNIR